MKIFVEHRCNDCGTIETTKHELPPDLALWRQGFLYGMAAVLLTDIVVWIGYLLAR